MTDVAQQAVDVINTEFIKEVRAGLEKGIPVRRKLTGWGRVHIDRQLPFLCVYRRPPHRSDAGTKRLLLGEAAYILASGEPDFQAGLCQLIKVVMDKQVANFGASLLLELWSALDRTQTETVQSQPQQPTIHIVVSRHNAPTALLERLESFLLRITIAGQTPGVRLDYREQIAPPDLEPLIMDGHNAKQGVYLIGLEVEPVYRDSKTGEIFPFELKELHHGLAYALKQSFYTFAHTFTTQRPAHYHELGRHAMTSAVWDTDRQLAEISDRFDILLHVTPVNASHAWMEFQANKFEQVPEFHYRPRPVDPDLLKRQLYQIPIERIEDPTLAYIFSAKRDELSRQITMIADRNTPQFMHGSQQVYGEVEEWLLQLAQQMLEKISPIKTSHDDECLDAYSFAEIAREEMAHYKNLYPDFQARVEVREDVTGIMVSHGHFLIGTDARVPSARVNATLAHEIGTHVVTYYNGRSQPFHQLHAGMAGYEPLQEGLAVLSEYLVGQLNSSRLRLLAGRVLAVHSLTHGASFNETFRELTHSHGFNDGVAFNIAMRVYRGGGFSKDAVYLRGLATLLEYLGEGNDLELLFLGKIALEHLPFIEELKWRKVLKAGPLRPRYLDDPQVAERLKRLQQGQTLQQLVEDCMQ